MSMVATYLLLMLDNIKHVLDCLMGWGMVYIIATVIVLFIAWTIYEDCYHKCDVAYSVLDFLGKRLKRINIGIFIAIWLIFGINSLIPTTRQMAIMYVVPEISMNEEAQKIPDNVLKFINQYLEDSIGEKLDDLKKDAKNQIVKKIQPEGNNE